MTLEELKERVRSLTPEERRELAALLIELDGEQAMPRAAQTFDAAKAYVFENYGELLRRLASIHR